ncbi:putative ATP-dependent RNA helicase [Sesbania bispinosa]|nr:putative ATP-dependent RNA helicase [Sesbania bispinosa]
MISNYHRKDAFALEEGWHPATANNANTTGYGCGRPIDAAATPTPANSRPKSHIRQKHVVVMASGVPAIVSMLGASVVASATRISAAKGCVLLFCRVLRMHPREPPRTTLSSGAVGVYSPSRHDAERIRSKIDTIGVRTHQDLGASPGFRRALSSVKTPSHNSGAREEEKPSQRRQSPSHRERPPAP